MVRPTGNRQKHENRNPVQAWLIARFHSEVLRLVERAEPTSILDVGCGEGYVLSVLRDGKVSAALHGIDLSEAAISDAGHRLGDAADLRVADARTLASADTRYDMVMMLEVLEHLDDPAEMLAVLGRLTSRWVVLSVPWEPYFRGLNLLRLKNVAALGNDPEHLNHWTRRGFERFVGSQFSVVAVARAFPWSLVLAERRRG